jgi:hypothetical protein
MDTRIVVLYYLCSAAGFIMILGGIWLLYREKIYIDTESKEVTEIETPIGKFKTNVPALALFALGFVPLIYPILKAQLVEDLVQIEGKVPSHADQMRIYAAVNNTEPNSQGGDFGMPVPFLKEKYATYTILYVLDDRVVSRDTATLDKAQQGHLALQPPLLPQWEQPPAEIANLQTTIQPIPAQFN